jgi:hypothetical protein
MFLKDSSRGRRSFSRFPQAEIISPDFRKQNVQWAEKKRNQCSFFLTSQPTRAEGLGYYCL